jgi:4-amino-4-deoxy-L-arabinose transferase-like glycosyltransferase
MLRLGSQERLGKLDYLFLVTFCTLVFGAAFVGGRYLTMHEAVLPQSAKEMYQNGEWVVPTSAGRPWLERPPLPQWITIAFAHCIGRFDQEWVVRLPSAFVATLSVLMTAILATRWFGRTVGMISGLALVTTLEFCRYAWLAEQDIYLCLLVTASMFVFGHLEFSSTPDNDPPATFFGKRRRGIALWFLLLGMTNLAKGLVFGTVIAAAPVAVFLMWNADLSRIRQYIWFWGGVIWLAVALAWPIAALIRYPDVVDLWSYDLLGRLSGAYTAINQPLWYYWVNLPVVTAPWFPVAVAGLFLTAKTAFRERYSAERFVCCWALVPLIVLSIPGGKHHHYLLSSVAPWAILTSMGLVRLRAWSLTWPGYLKSALAGVLFVGLPFVVIFALVAPMLHGPDLFPIALAFVAPLIAALLAYGVHHRRGAIATGSLFGFVGLLFMTGLSFAAIYLDECRNDTLFLKSVRARIDQDDMPIVVNADLESMDIFRILFYLGEEASSVHNLTFLRDPKFNNSSLYVVTRAKDLDELRQLGIVEEIERASETRREKSPGDRFALFRLTYFEDTVRIPSRGVRISPMQAMDRAPGPYLGIRSN